MTWRRERDGELPRDEGFAIMRMCMHMHMHVASLFPGGNIYIHMHMPSVRGPGSMIMHIHMHCPKIAEPVDVWPVKIFATYS